MDDHAVLADRVEAHRSHVRAVAYRMLGSLSEADDAVQEAWLRLSRTDHDSVENLGGWLTTVVARVCLDMLRSRTSRREEPLEASTSEPIMSSEGTDPEHEAMQADAVGFALLVVLETLTPAERLAFVLHDLFAVPFEEIATIVDRSPAATRQLAGRARRRVRGVAPDSAPGAARDRSRRREIVEAFLAASRGGDFATLLSLLDPDAVVRADPAAVQMGASDRVDGARAVAETFSGHARAARAALLDGVPGALWTAGGRPRVAFEFTIAEGRIVRIDLIADPARLADLEIADLPQ